jgi:hypothetical protein
MGNHRWFVTAQYVEWAKSPDHRAWVSHEPRRVARSMAHAKTVGTDLTACGLRAVSWEKLWGCAFPPDDGEVCQQCLWVLDRATGRTTLRAL